MLIDENGEEGIKIFLGLDDDDIVTEGMCIGILKNGSFVVASFSMRICTKTDVIDMDVEVIASYS